MPAWLVVLLTVWLLFAVGLWTLLDAAAEADRRGRRK